MRRFVALAILVLFFPWTARGTEPERRETVRVEAQVHGLGLTPEQARREALQRARETAVAQVGGLHVASRQTRLRSEGGDQAADAFASLISTSTEGRIVGEEVSHSTTLVQGVPVYHVVLLAEVVIERGIPDPGFVLQVRTDPAARILRDGERITIEVNSSRSCHLTLLNVMGDGRVSVLFPSQPDLDNRVEGGATFHWPAPERGYELEVRLSPGHHRDHEQLLAIATLDPVPFDPPASDDDDEVGLVADHEVMLAALNRWLVTIPAHRRAEAIWSYEIVE